jgi:DNA-binding transcriptional regulator YhcF (GntR family)
VEGWIKLYRKLIENPIFLKPELLQLFIYCLLKANHEAQKIIFNGQEIEIKPGQFITGRNIMAADLKQNPITTYKRLKILENLQILNIKSNNKFSVVTVVNYGLYQSEEIKRNTKRNNKGTTREQQGNTNKNDKNDKNDKKYKIIRSPIEIAIDDFKEFRKKIKKPMTDRAVELLIDKLNKLASDDETKIAILNQSIVNGWQGIFPLKEDTQRQSGTNNPFLQEGV